MATEPTFDLGTEPGTDFADDLDTMADFSPELTPADWAIVKQALVVKASAGNLQAIALIFRMAKMPAYQAACEAAKRRRQSRRHRRPAPRETPSAVASPMESAPASANQEAPAWPPARAASDSADIPGAQPAPRENRTPLPNRRQSSIVPMPEVVGALVGNG